MNIKYVLRKDRNPNEFGEYGVYLQSCTQGVPVKASTGFFVKPEHWLGDDGRSIKFVLGGKVGNPKSDQLNKVLLNRKKEIERTIESVMVDKNCVMTVPMLQSIMNGTYQEHKDNCMGKVPFVDYVLEFNKDLYNLGKISYSVWNNTECNMGLFRKFIQKVFKRDTTPSNILYCKDLTVEHIKKYIMWRKDRGNKNETINHSLTPIFKAVKQMCRKKWLDRDICDEILDQYVTAQAVSLDTPGDDIKYLTVEQMKSLIQLTGESKYPRTKELMDLFFFSVHCCGLRFSDICTLRWKEVDVERRLIKHLMVKNHTKKPKYITIPLSDEAIRILDRWNGRYDNFVFGQLPDDFDLGDEQMLKEVTNSRNRTINQSLRVMGKKLGLPYNLHFHVSRHTFATIARNNGVEMDRISKLLGHSSTLVTDKVYAQLFPETLLQTMDEKLNFSFTNESDNEGMDETGSL